MTSPPALPSMPGTPSWALRIGEVVSTHVQVAGRVKVMPPAGNLAGASAPSRVIHAINPADIATKSLIAGGISG